MFCFHRWRQAGQADGWSVGQPFSHTEGISFLGHWLGGVRCATSQFDLDLTFDLSVATLTLKIWSVAISL